VGLGEGTLGKASGTRRLRQRTTNKTYKETDNGGYVLK